MINILIQPQKGKQEQFLSKKYVDVDIAFYGGAAGGGKTHALLLESMRGWTFPYYNSIIFRKNITHINKAGGLYDAAQRLYRQFEAHSVRHFNTFFFKNYNSKIQLAHLERDDDCYNYDGTEICLICFDELTHFSKFQFFYLLSRNRSTCGVKPRVRATCNPDPDSWVREFIDFYIDNKTGFAIEERCGLIRYFVNIADEIHWFDTNEEAKEAFPLIKAKSFTFINSNIYDNKILLKKNPDYLSNLQALKPVQCQRLLYGNWNIKLGAGDFFKTHYFEIIKTAPPLKKICRAWDFALTKPSERNPDPDFTVACKVAVDFNGVYYVLDLIRFRENPFKVEQFFHNITTSDGNNCISKIPQDAGGMAKGFVANLVKNNPGFQIKIEKVSKSKETRAGNASSQAGINNVKLIKADWNQSFLIELESFPIGNHDDQVDAFSDAINELTLNNLKPIEFIDKPYWLP